MSLDPTLRPVNVFFLSRDSLTCSLWTTTNLNLKIYGSQAQGVWPFKYTAILEKCYTSSVCQDIFICQIDYIFLFYLSDEAVLTVNTCTHPVTDFVLQGADDRDDKTICSSSFIEKNHELLMTFTSGFAVYEQWVIPSVSAQDNKHHGPKSNGRITEQEHVSWG